MGRRRLNKDAPKKEKRAELTRIAVKLFLPTEKNPYHHSRITIRNFSGLKKSLNRFTGKEAQWIASWIEYLGDVKTATKIRQTPSEFKEIITARFNELKPYADISKISEGPKRRRKRLAVKNERI